MKQPVSLIALDMDGTLFNGQSEISKEDQDAIREASSRGIHVAISTGRPYAGLPVTLLSGLGVSYAITSNGAAVYHLPNRLCIHESAMEPALVCPIICLLYTSPDTADDQISALNQFMHVVTHSYSHDTLPSATRESSGIQAVVCPGIFVLS